METGKCSNISCAVTSPSCRGIMKAGWWACLPAFHLISLGNSAGRHLWKSSSCRMDKCIFSFLPRGKWKLVISSPIAVNTKSKEANLLWWQLQKEFFFEDFFSAVLVYLALKPVYPASFQQPPGKPLCSSCLVFIVPCFQFCFAKQTHFCHDGLRC